MNGRKALLIILTWSFCLLMGWVLCVVLCASETLQRDLFYFNKASVRWAQRLDSPESFGFLQNQVLPLDIPTADGCELYAWLVTPLALYAKNERDLVEKDRIDNYEHDPAIKLLQDPDSLLVIYFHGNAGTIGQTRRTDAYRMISSGSSQRIHVLAFDYRGFGKSTGTPTEAGLIEDTLSIIKWATTVGRVPTERIVLFGHSLGTAVVVGAVEALLKDDPHTNFAGIILCAAFTDATSAIMSYRIAGLLPIFPSLRGLETLRAWFISSIHDKWRTKERLRHIVRSSRRLRLTLFAATSDRMIPSSNTEELFDSVSQELLESTQPSDHSSQQVDIRSGGTMQECQVGNRVVKKVLVRFGGHNGIIKWAPVALEVLKSFGLDL